MKNWSKRKKILAGLLVLFLAAQAIQPSKNRGSATGPKDITSFTPVPDSVMTVLKKSCYDCHSNYTTYPWYDNITPLNWWVAHHIDEGKRELNFTTFGEYTARKQAKKLEESAEQVQEGEMPLKSYLITHGDARLSDAQKAMLVTWFKRARERTGIAPEAETEQSEAVH